VFSGATPRGTWVWVRYLAHQTYYIGRSKPTR